MAIFGTSEAAKSQKGGQTWQKKMMQSAHQWEQQDLQLAGLNPILSAVGGSPGSYSSSAPIGPSSAQEVASLAQAGSNVIEGVGKGIQFDSADARDQPELDKTNGVLRAPPRRGPNECKQPTPVEFETLV